jgi:hypothetical protein
LDDDTEISFDAGGCSGWHYQINCVAHAMVGRSGDGDSGESVVLLCEVDAEEDEDLLEQYASPRRLEYRRRFTDFEILWVAAILHKGNNDPNGVHTILFGSQIDQPEYEW